MTGRIDGWCLGLPALAGLVALTIFHAAPRIEGDLRRRVVAGEAALRRGGEGGFRISVAGRDATVLADPGLPDAVLRDAEARANAVAGIRRVATAFTEARAMQPFSLTFERRGDALILSGGVPSGATRAALVALLGDATPATVDDRLQVALGAPDGFDAAAAFGARAIARLADGRVEVTGTGIAVDGSAADQAAYRALRAAPPDLPAGFTLSRFAILPPLVDEWDWAASRTGDELVLSGSVPSEEGRAAIVAASRAALPTGRVVDRMDTARGADGRIDPVAAARAAVAGLGAVQGGDARLSGRDLAFAATSPARDLKGEIWDQLRTQLATTGARLGAFDVRTVPAVPYSVELRRDAQGIAVAGYLPDAAARDDLMAALGRDFPAEPIRGRVRLADGAPEGLADALATARSTLREMADGSATIRDRSLALGGTLLYPELARRLRAATAAPAGWSLAADLRSVPIENALDATRCGDLLADSVGREPVRFAPGRADLAGAETAVTALAAVLRRCGDRAIVVEHAVASPAGAEPGDLARQRAEALRAALAAVSGEARLRARGVDGRRGGAADGETRLLVEDAAP